MVAAKLCIYVVLFIPVLLAAAHPSPSGHSPVPQQISNGTASSSVSSSSPRSGFNTAARSAGKLCFGTATNNYQLNDAAYVARQSYTTAGMSSTVHLPESALIAPCSSSFPSEPLNDDTTWRETLWYATLNASYIPLALHAARLADPHAKLYINEYNTTGPGPKASALKELVRELKAAGIPLHGVGVQAHETRNLAEFAALGVEVAIRVLDVWFGVLPPDEAGLEQQRRDFETIVRACREVEGCVGITVWDWTDKYSWVPASFPGEGDACPFDACPFDTNLEPKPACNGIIDGLEH